MQVKKVFKSCDICGKPIDFLTVNHAHYFRSKSLYGKRVCYECYNFHKCIKKSSYKINDYYVTYFIQNNLFDFVIKMKVYNNEEHCNLVITRDIKDLHSESSFIHIMNNKQVKKKFTVEVCHNNVLLEQIYVYLKKDIYKTSIFIGV